MNTNHTLFYQINAGALAHIYVAGCIRPTSLIERREFDIQSQFSQHLLLSTKKWSNQNDCSLKIILKDEEHKRLIDVSDEYYLYDSILPVSRIEKIYFSDAEKAKNILWNIQNGAAFIPDSIIEIASKKQGDITKKKQIKSNISNDKYEENERLSKKFNRLLGGVAFLRTALNDYTDSHLNYPEEYIPTVTFFNSYLKNEFEKTNISKEYKLHSYFQNKEDIIKYIGKDINDEIINSVSREEKIAVIKKLGVYDIEKIPPYSLTYLLCILNIYGINRTKSVDDFINDMLKRKSKRSEELALLMGIHTGYESFRNTYRISEKRVNVKFEFESKLDYYIVESIFEYVNNRSVISGRFDYIDSMTFVNKNIFVDKNYINYSFLGSVIITKKIDYNNYFYKLINNIVGDLCSMVNGKYLRVDKEKMIDDIMNNNTNLFKEIISVIRNEGTSSFISNSSPVKKSINNIDLRYFEDKTSLFEINKKKKIKDTEKNIVNELFQVEQNPVTFNKDSIMKAGSVKRLKDIAAQYNIYIPKSISKKEDIINLLLSKIKE